MDTLIANVTIVTMNEAMEVLFGSFLGVEDGKICYIGRSAPTEPPKTLIDGTGMVLMPGLVNCHTHLAEAALRSYCDELSPAQALEQQLRLEDKMDRRCAKAAATLAIAECLRFGITSVSDLYYYPDATAEAVADSGIKANLALSSYRFIDQNEDFDFETDEQCAELRRLVQKWQGYDDGRIRIDAGIYGEYTSNYRLWEALAGYAVQEGLGFQLHLAEGEREAADCLERTGLGPGELLNCHGLFRVNVTAAGCGALTEQERQILGRHKATAVACPISAAKRGEAQTPVTACVKAGMNVALGSDGVVEGGSADLFEAMRSLALSARAGGEQLPASAALMMATVCGAQAQGRANSCGMIKEGFDADLILVDFSAPHLMPCHNVLSALVYSAQGGDVAMTMVRGKILYRNGQFPTIDLPAAVRELTEYAIPRMFAGDGT